MKTLIVIALMILMLFIGFFRGILVNEEIAVRALETQGYSDITIKNKSWLVVGMRGCDDRDAARFTAIAANPVGQEVELYVCVGWPFKGATVRTR